MQQMDKTWAQKGWAAAEGRPPSFVHLLHLLRCFYMLFACFAFVLHFIYILFASLLGMMRQLLRQWLIVQYGTILYNIIPYSFFPWPMYKRCAAKNNHRRLENKGELLTTSK